MTSFRLIIAAAALIAAAVLQMTMASTLAIGAARPDFILTTIACLAALLGTSGGAAAGVIGGFLTAIAVGVNFGSFLVSRALIGASAGWLSESFFSDFIIVTPLTAFFATICCETIYYIMAPAHRGLWWVERVLLEALYNLVLAVPITLALRRLGFRPETPGAFRD